MLGHEHVVAHDVVGSGAAQADGVPHVVDAVLRARHEERPHVDGPGVRVHDEAAEQRPVRVVTAGGEAPGAADAEAAVDGCDLAGRGVRGADPGRRVGAPHLFLGTRVVERDVPGVDADDGRDPAGGAAGSGDLADGGVEDGRVGGESAVGPGLEEPEEAGLLQVLDRRVGHLAQRLRLGGAFAQRRREGADRFEYGGCGGRGFAHAGALSWVRVRVAGPYARLPRAENGWFPLSGNLGGFPGCRA